MQTYAVTYTFFSCFRGSEVTLGRSWGFRELTAQGIGLRSQGSTYKRFERLFLGGH